MLNRRRKLALVKCFSWHAHSLNPSVLLLAKKKKIITLFLIFILKLSVKWNTEFCSCLKVWMHAYLIKSKQTDSSSSDLACFLFALCTRTAHMAWGRTGRKTSLWEPFKGLASQSVVKMKDINKCQRASTFIYYNKKKKKPLEESHESGKGWIKVQINQRQHDRLMDW